MRVTIFLPALLLLAGAVHANSTYRGDGSGISAQRLTDAQGNSYGIVRIDLAAGARIDGYGALESVVRYANALAGRNRGKGNTVRLKRHGGHHHCAQLLRGTEQSNFLDGSMSDCDETISGYGGDDILVGGPGNNSLDGGKGADFVTGGGGTDRFVYERAGDSTPDAPDVVTDFNSRDVLDLGGVAVTSGVPLSFIGWNPFSGVPGQVNYYRTEYWKCDPNWHCRDSYLTVVQADLTGDRLADFSIDLDGIHSLESRNLVLGPSQPKLAHSTFN